MDQQQKQLDLNVLSRQIDSIGGEIMDAVRRVVASGRFILGRECEAFEAEYAAYCGARHCIGLANGTDAIELALRAAGIRPGCRVATVANAGGYATTAILAIGAEPVYVDVVAQTGLLDAAQLAVTLNAARIDAIVVTHLFGRMAEVETIVALCSAANIPVVEDCAQAHGARRGGRSAGTFGMAGCFSFYPTKNLGGIGDGGCVITDDDRVAETVRSLRQYGWGEKYHIVRDGGRNSRLDEIQAAVLRAKLPHLATWNSGRRAIAARFADGIRHAEVVCPPPADEDDVVHLYVVRARRRDHWRRHLAAAGIRTDIHYPVPDHRQPCVARLKSWPELPATEALAGSILTLPCFPEMTDQEVGAVIDAVNSG